MQNAYKTAESFARVAYIRSYHERGTVNIDAHNEFTRYRFSADDPYANEALDQLMVQEKISKERAMEMLNAVEIPREADRIRYHLRTVRALELAGINGESVEHRFLWVCNSSSTRIKADYAYRKAQSVLRTTFERRWK